VIALAALAAMAAVALVGRPRRPAGSRLAATLAQEQPALVGSSDGVADPVGGRGSLPRLASATVVLVAGPVALGGGFGVVLGLAGALVVGFFRRSREAARVDPDDVPVVVDLVAGCLAAGTGLAAALDAASVAAGEVMRASCRAVAAALRAGVPPEEAWRSWLSDPWLAPVARTAVRTSHSGAAAAADLRRTSARLRSRRRAAAQHKVRQASVWLVVPLGLCFLPAFVLVAVVPLVVGLVPSLR
jgi:Flp pilus assembly protein TadB